MAWLVSGVQGDERVNGAAPASVHLFGVRHLSPGGSTHLRAFLDRIEPSAILIEGPSDATSEIRHLTNRLTKPPVAILAFTSELPVRTLLWPFAAYSPELAALQWAAVRGVHAAFIDLPSSVAVKLHEAREAAEAAECEAEPADGEDRTDVAIHKAALTKDTPNRSDRHAMRSAHYEEQNVVYAKIAELAGEYDYDTYWERHFEHNLNPDAYRSAILEFSRQMRELSEPGERLYDPAAFAYNAVREAYMKKQIAAAIADGHAPDKIVVVCGAYHAFALADLSEAMTGEECAKLPSRETKLTLMPYSYYKLSSMSGYGAGNGAPYYFEMMWRFVQQDRLNDLPHTYLSKVAGYLREKGSHRSTAEVIEGVRLAESLAALHGGSAPTLRDLRDAAQTALGYGDLSVVAEALAAIDVGTAIGELAEGVSQTPIQEDLNRLLRKLKLDKYKTTVATDLALDLRENRRVQSEEAAFLDLHRSFFLHRLKLLGIRFAVPAATGQDKATWAERWVMQWSPETEIQLVESTLLGETVELAAAFVLQQKLEQCATLSEASKLIRIACECGMIAQMKAARETLQRLAVDSQDVAEIASAARSLSLVIGYGDIRRFDSSPLLPLLQQLFFRASLYLVDAAGCTDEAAAAMLTAMNELNAVAQEHDQIVDEPLWIRELRHLAERDDRNPRLSGFACAILLERNELSAQICAEEVSRRLSPGIPADLGAGWFEGLSMRNRYALLSRSYLWEQLDGYVESLDDLQFRRALVFLRRAFSAFEPREKTMVAELLGELWGVDEEQAAEALTGELSEDDTKLLDDLNDFDFGDL